MLLFPSTQQPISMATTKRQQRLYRCCQRKYYSLFNDNNGVDEVDERGVVANILWGTSLSLRADLSFLRRIIWSFHVEKSKIDGQCNAHISANNWNFDKIFSWQDASRYLQQH